MGKLTTEKRDEMMAELLGGSTPKSLQQKYGISKQAFYNIKNNHIKNDSKMPEPKQVKSKEVVKASPEAMYDPENMKEYIEKEETKAEEPKASFRIPKALLESAKEKVKPKATPKKKAVIERDESDDEDDEDDQEIKKIICKIRQYVVAFDDNKYIQDYVGKDVDKFLLGLDKKNEKDLNNILEYIRFHIRNKGSDSKFLENGITTFMILIEKIAWKVGVDLDGLAKDIAVELNEPSSDLKRSLIEISIDMDVSKYFSNPKMDLGMNIAQKILFTHQKNKHLRRLQTTEEMKPPPAPTKSVEVILSTGLDEDLKQKYQDL